MGGRSPWSLWRQSGLCVTPGRKLTSCSGLGSGHQGWKQPGRAFVTWGPEVVGGLWLCPPRQSEKPEREASFWHLPGPSPCSWAACWGPSDHWPALQLPAPEAPGWHPHCFLSLQGHRPVTPTPHSSLHTETSHMTCLTSAGMRGSELRCCPLPPRPFHDQGVSSWVPLGAGWAQCPVSAGRQ